MLIEAKEAKKIDIKARELEQLAPATAQGAIDAMCSFETFPAAVSDDVEALREHARKICDRFSTVEGWNTFEVPVIGDDSDDD